MGGHQLLVGGDHALARLQGPGGKVQSDGGPADGLHHDIHLGVVLDHSEVLHKPVRIRAVRKVPHIHDIFQPHQVVHPVVDEAAVGGEHLSHAGAHRPKA